MKSYAKFFSMIGTSAVVMFGVMYLNTFRIEDLFFSRTRFFMMLMMASVMALIMVLYMWGMYKNKKLNIAILVASVVVFVLSLTVVRTQFGIGDEAWMKAMIPHHSIAILTSSEANISDPRVKELAERIIANQKTEIEEMKALIQELRSAGVKK